MTWTERGQAALLKQMPSTIGKTSTSKHSRPTLFTWPTSPLCGTLGQFQSLTPPRQSLSPKISSEPVGHSGSWSPHGCKGNLGTVSSFRPLWVRPGARERRGPPGEAITLFSNGGACRAKMTAPWHHGDRAKTLTPGGCFGRVTGCSFEKSGRGRNGEKINKARTY